MAFNGGIGMAGTLKIGRPLLFPTAVNLLLPLLFPTAVNLVVNLLPFSPFFAFFVKIKFCILSKKRHFVKLCRGCLVCESVQGEEQKSRLF
jgi:hypothetical protein